MSGALVVLYSIRCRRRYSYVSFMKVEKSSYLKIPINWLYSIFILFLVAVIIRYLWILSPPARAEPEEADPTKTPPRCDADFPSPSWSRCW